MSRSLLIINHKNAGDSFNAHYLLNLMRREWEQSGWTVASVNGTDRAIPADVALLHVDLSLVPEEYREFATSYPVALNANIMDIRKRSYSLNRVIRGDGYDGPVIVKSDLNSAGFPEIKLRYPYWSPLGLAGRFLARKGIRFPGGLQSHYPYAMRGKQDYRIFNSVREMPEELFDCPALIVEKFIPELQEGRYCLREWYFFGDASINRAELSADPVSTYGDHAPHLEQAVPQELSDLRRKLGLDYGKIDYVIHKGYPVVFDINKTIGARRNPTEGIMALSASLAKGLNSFTTND